jgi:seryl-tRNA(Sec) selenium transferase
MWQLLPAMRIARALAPYDTFWHEDPIKMDSLASLKRYAEASPAPICASETLGSRFAFRDLLETGVAGVIMLDVAWCGGLSEARKIAAMAEAWHLPVAPHDCTGPVVLCASTHLSLNAPNALIQESVRAGVDIITFSGDKLLGGPQAGLVVGKAEYVERMKKHPLARAVRVDKMTLAGIEATLMEYLDMENVCTKNPTLRMITSPAEALKARAKKIARLLDSNLGETFTVTTEPETSKVGGDSLPLAELPTTVVSITSTKASANRLEEMLRANEPPIIVRIKEDAVLLDPRTIQEGEEREILEALKRVEAR